MAQHSHVRKLVGWISQRGRLIVPALGILACLTILTGCAELGQSAPTPTPLIVYVVVTPTTAPTDQTSATPTTLSAASTTKPTTEYKDSETGISVQLPGSNWRKPSQRDDNPAFQGGSVTTTDVSRVFSQQRNTNLIPRNNSELREAVDDIRSSSSIQSSRNVSDENFHGYQAVRFEATIEAQQVVFKTVSYVFVANNSTYIIMAGAFERDWENGGKEDVQAMLNNVSISTLSTGMGDTGVPSGAIDRPVTFEGNGSLTTKSFELSGGDYTLTWSATAVDDATCYQIGQLEAVDPDVFVNELFGEVPSGTTARSGSTEIYNIKRGKYYFKLTSSCSWTVKIEPSK